MTDGNYELLSEVITELDRLTNITENVSTRLSRHVVQYRKESLDIHKRIRRLAGIVERLAMMNSEGIK